MPFGDGQTTLEIGGVTCSIIEDGIKEEWPAEQGFTSTATFKCLWADRYRLVGALLPGAVLSGKTIVRKPPYFHPEFPLAGVVSIGTITGVRTRRDAFNWLQYEFAIIPANFGIYPFMFVNRDPDGQYDPSGKAWTIVKARIGASVFKPPGGSYLYTSGPNSGQPVRDSDVGIIRPHTELSVTRKFLPYNPVKDIQIFIGSINSIEVQVQDQFFARGKLLFTGGSTEPAFDGVGRYVTHAEYTFLGSDRDWNSIMGTDGAFHVINTAADLSGNFPYPYLDAWNFLP